MDPGEGSECQENPGVQVQVIHGWTRVVPYDRAHIIYDSHFQMCLLVLVEEPGSSALRMIHHFSELDQFGDSTNSWVYLNDFPNRWLSAAQMADSVSVHLIPYPYLPPFNM